MTKNDFILRFATVAAFTLYLCQPEQALSQALPWQQSPQAGQAQQTQQVTPSHHHGNHSATPANASSSGSNTRNADDRELNTLAGKFYAIHSKDKDAVAKLKKLEGEVKTFNATLKTKSYDADILKDAQSLEHRIAAQLKEWEEAQEAAAKPAATPPAPPVSAPAR